ncbi:hypothetical protein EDB85DRAFT_1886735 [Lactarius pseudohatsudake]|nr:hypothetical protein EDB85DRAFT_1886735 [Lactarius pseudohatsudake]
MAFLIEQHDQQLTAMSEPTGLPHRGEPMDIDVSVPLHSLPSLSDGHTLQGLLPFLGEVVNGAHEVALHDLTNLSCVGLRELCNAFCLVKTGNKTTLKDRLKNFSADWQGWDSLLPGACKKHCGPQDGGVMKSTKGPGKRASVKWSTLRRELLFSGAPNGMGSMTRPCLPTERSKDMCTDKERAVLLMWVHPRPTSSTPSFLACSDHAAHIVPSFFPFSSQTDSFMVHNPYEPEPEPENEPSPPNVSRGWDGTVHIHGDISNAPSSLEGPPTSPHLQLQLQLQQVQAQLAMLVAAIASGNSSDLAPSPAAVMGAPAPAPTHRGPGTTNTTNTNTTTDGPPPTSTCQRPLALATSAPQGPLEYLQLRNGRPLCFSRQSVPDPPAISFTKDLPRLVVLRIQGEPIALKHWPAVYCYCYDKSRQWAGMKKNWANWQYIATSWNKLTDDGFWQKFTANSQLMSYTAICEALKEERMATNHHVAKQAKDKYGDRFGAAFKYWRGSDHIVRNKFSAIARHYHTLHVSD